jgi:hypothetical protein
MHIAADADSCPCSPCLPTCLVTLDTRVGLAYLSKLLLYVFLLSAEVRIYIGCWSSRIADFLLLPSISSGHLPWKIPRKQGGQVTPTIFSLDVSLHLHYLYF